MQCYTVYFIWKLLYVFRAVPPPIIRSASNCIYSIWCLSHHYCYLPLSAGTGLSVLWVAYATHSTLKPVPTKTIAGDSSNSVTNTRCCGYSCLCS